jgi:quercetin dioxygenase-like cupin family protein
LGDETRDVVEGEGYAVGSVDSLGGGYGFRKVRRALGVTAFGVNAVVLPPRYRTGRHYHDEQEELYFVHRGEIEIGFGDGSKHTLGAGGMSRVDPSTVREIRNLTDEDAIYLVAGGKDGYVGRDGHAPDDEESPRGAALESGPPGAVGGGPIDPA